MNPSIGLEVWRSQDLNLTPLGALAVIFLSLCQSKTKNSIHLNHCYVINQHFLAKQSLNCYSIMVLNVISVEMPLTNKKIDEGL